MAKVHQGSRSARLWVSCPENDPGNTAVYDGPGAHGAGLKGDKQGQSVQPPTVAGCGGGPDGDHLGVGRGVGVAFTSVLPGRYHLSGGGVHDDATDRDFASLGREFRLTQGQRHPVIVIEHGSGHRNDR